MLFIIVGNTVSISPEKKHLTLENVKKRRKKKLNDRDTQLKLQKFGTNLTTTIIFLSLHLDFDVICCD